MSKTIKADGSPLTVTEAGRRRMVRRKADIAAAEHMDREGGWVGERNYRELREQFIEDYMRAHGFTKTGLSVVTKCDVEAPPVW